MHIRGYVIEYSVAVERLVSELLALAIGVDINHSSFFGRESSLSFKNKMDMLSELTTIGDDAIKINWFSAIRNKFAHNRDVRTFYDAYLTKKSILNEKLMDFFKEKYPLPQPMPNDAEYKYYFDELQKDVVNICVDLIYKIAKEKGKSVYYLQSVCTSCNKENKIASSLFIINNSPNVREDLKKQMVRDHHPIRYQYCFEELAETKHKLDVIILRAPTDT